MNYMASSGSHVAWALTSFAAFTIAQPAAAAIIDLPTAKVVQNVAPSLVVENPKHWEGVFAWGELHKQLARWERLPADWDGDDGIAPDAATLHRARHFLATAEAARIQLPESYIEGDGEVGYRWRANGRLATASFLPDGHLAAFIPGRGAIMRVDQPYPAGVNVERLLSALRTFATAA